VEYYHNDKLVAERKNNSEMMFYHPDSLGSTSLITNSTGGLIESTIYEPWGKVYLGGTKSRFDFTGKETDSTGHIYFGFRFMNPLIGKFIQPDDLLPELYNPQSFNRYSYVLNNPYIYVDPDGHRGFLFERQLDYYTKQYEYYRNEIVTAANNAWHSVEGYQVYEYAAKGAAAYTGVDLAYKASKAFIYSLEWDMSKSGLGPSRQEIISSNTDAGFGIASYITGGLYEDFDKLSKYYAVASGGGDIIQDTLNYLGNAISNLQLPTSKNYCTPSEGLQYGLITYDQYMALTDLAINPAQGSGGGSKKDKDQNPTPKPSPNPSGLKYPWDW
jgi:RHS repeat-associated protein